MGTHQFLFYHHSWNSIVLYCFSITNLSFSARSTLSWRKIRHQTLRLLGNQRKRFKLKGRLKRLKRLRKRLEQILLPMSQRILKQNIKPKVEDSPKSDSLSKSGPIREKKKQKRNQ